MALAGEPVQTSIHFLGILFGKLWDRVNAKLLKVAQHRWPNRDEVSETAIGRHEGSFLYSLYFRHRL